MSAQDKVDLMMAPDLKQWTAGSGKRLLAQAINFRRERDAARAEADALRRERDAALAELAQAREVLRAMSHTDDPR